MQLRALVASSAMLLLASCASTPSQPARTESKAAETLDFELPDAASKNPVKASDYRGRVVLVDIFATWCKPCEASMGFYADLFRRYQEKGFTLLAVSVDAHDEDLQRFLQTHALPFPVLHDPSGSLAAKLDIQVMPTSLTLDREGHVVNVHPGFIDSDRPMIESLVAQALK
jgi:peroxiredoxin